MTDISSLLKAAPVVAQARSFSELAKNVTNISDPVNASFSAAKLIVNVCTPPHIKFPVKCTILALQLGVCLSTGGLGTVTGAALAIGSGKQILEELV
jgi:hypothetical protein